MGRYVPAVVLALVGCADAPPLPGVCEGERGPARPAIASPIAHRKDVTAASFVVDATPPDDPDGDLLAVTEYEVWTVNADGSSRELVWTARNESSHPPPLALSSGSYLGTAAVLGALETWRDHVVRVRHTTRSVDGCDQVGPWSEAVPFRTDDGSAALFDDSMVRDVALQLPPASYAAIDAEAMPPGCVPYERNYYGGDLTFAGQTFTGVGVKVKGGCGSARRLDRKPGWKVSLDWDDPAVAGCPDARRVGGLSGLTFNNMVQDKSLSHERLAYAFFAAMDVPVPRTSPVRVRVNGALYGHYLHVETVDRRFLDRHFASNQGMLYEGTYWCDLTTNHVRDDDSGCITREFRPDACDGAPAPGADPVDYTPLRAMIARLDALPPGGFYPAITQILDWDRYLSMWAAEAVLSHWDGYSYDIINNYRLYHDPSRDRWTIIPSGLDQTFQPGSIDVWAPSGRIAQRCLAEPACEATFAARLYDAVRVWRGLELERRRQAIVAQLQPLVTAEPGREFNLGEWQNAHGETAGFIAARAGEILNDLRSRGH